MKTKSYATIIFAVFLVLSGLPSPAVAVPCFLPGAHGACSRPVLQHVKFKSVVTELVDPQNTGIGHSLSRLLWRELRVSTFDVAGSGVILAHDKGDEMMRAVEGREYLDYLQSDYHEAAMHIARSLNVQMSLWGVVLEEDDSVFIQPFLTILPTDQDPWTRLRISTRNTRDLELAAPLGHDRLNFQPISTERNRLFAHRFATRCALKAGCPSGVPVRGGPSNDDPIVGYVPDGRSVQALDMVEQWFRIERPEGETAYINIYHLHITPPSVHAKPRTNVNIRPAPAASDALGKVDLSGDYDVIDVGTDGRDRIWYRLKVGGREGWIAGWLFTPNFTFPVVHFVEGLYRYARHDFDGSIAALRRFIARSPRESNVTVAAAHQFLATARLASEPTNSLSAIELVLGDLDEAVSLTPFDPNAYVLRSLVKLGSVIAVEEGIDDLERALDLDARNDAARILLRNLDQLDRQNGIEALTEGRPLQPDAAQRLATLRERYL